MSKTMNTFDRFQNVICVFFNSFCRLLPDDLPIRVSKVYFTSRVTITHQLLCVIPLHYGSIRHTICFSQTQLYEYLDNSVYVSRK